MLITCPQCNFSKNIADDQIPPRSSMANCPQCGCRFQFRTPVMSAEETEKSHNDHNDPTLDLSYGADGRLTKKNIQAQPNSSEKIQQEQETSCFDTADISEKPIIEVPFENLSTFGFFSALVQTIRRVCFFPKLFFTVMPLRGYTRPFVFSLLIAEFIQIMDAFWQISNIPTLSTLMLQHLGLTSDPIALITPLNIFIITPLRWIFSLAFATLLTHGALSIIAKPKQGFEGTFRVIAYSYTPFLLASIPFGNILGFVWWLLISVIGLKYIHSVSYTRSILAHVLPGLVISLPLLFIMFISTASNTVN